MTENADVEDHQGTARRDMMAERHLKSNLLVRDACKEEPMMIRHIPEL